MLFCVGFWVVFLCGVVFCGVLVGGHYLFISNSCDLLKHLLASCINFKII